MQEVAGEAGLYFDPNNYMDIAEKMMLIYKDETLRNGLIEKGEFLVNRFDWQQNADRLWNIILKTAQPRVS
jgi:glycosyltransferase involved in cell wall biosynthesis